MKFNQALLWPLAVPYELFVRLRAQAYDHEVFRPHRLEGVVISVGNLTVGGTGKTPMVVWIAERLLAERKSVGILTRGYRGSHLSRAAPATEGSGDGESTSDEVRLLKSRLGDRVAFGVGPDRFARGARLAARGINYFVLDDGFQHRKLARNVDIVLIDATNPFGGGHLLPVGRLREPRSALARASIVVITRGDHSPAIEAAIRQDSNAPIFYARPEPDSAHLVEDTTAADITILRARKLFAFCGIGNPSAFLSDLRQWGFPVTGHKFFPDHHRYTTRDALAICSEARHGNAEALICTEKDYFNLDGLRDHSCWSSLPLHFLRISLHIDRSDEYWRAVSAQAGRAKS